MIKLKKQKKGAIKTTPPNTLEKPLTDNASSLMEELLVEYENPRTRLCFVKLQRVPDWRRTTNTLSTLQDQWITEKDQEEETDCSKTKIQSPNSSTMIRECRVNILRTPLKDKKHNDNQVTDVDSIEFAEKQIYENQETPKQKTTAKSQEGFDEKNRGNSKPNARKSICFDDISDTDQTVGAMNKIPGNCSQKRKCFVKLARICNNKTKDNQMLPTPLAADNIQQSFNQQNNAATSPQIPTPKKCCIKLVRTPQRINLDHTQRITGEETTTDTQEKETYEKQNIQIESDADDGVQIISSELNITNGSAQKAHVIQSKQRLVPNDKLQQQQQDNGHIMAEDVCFLSKKKSLTPTQLNQKECFIKLKRTPHHTKFNGKRQLFVGDQEKIKQSKMPKKTAAIISAPNFVKEKVNLDTDAKMTENLAALSQGSEVIIDGVISESDLNTKKVIPIEEISKPQALVDHYTESPKCSFAEFIGLESGHRGGINTSTPLNRPTKYAYSVQNDRINIFGKHSTAVENPANGNINQINHKIQELETIDHCSTDQTECNDLYDEGKNDLQATQSLAQFKNLPVLKRRPLGSVVSTNRVFDEVNLYVENTEDEQEDVDMYYELNDNDTSAPVPQNDSVNESGHNKQSYPASPVAHQIVCPIITAERRNAFKKLSLNNTADRRDKETAKENLPDNTNTSVVVAVKKFAQAGAKPKQLKITTRSKAITKNNAKKIHFLEFESEQNSTILDLPEQRKTKILENHTSAGQDEQNNNSSVSNLNQSTTLVDTATIPAAHKKEKKFFHRSTNSKANKQKNDLNQKRSTIVRREKVYEFLSQSQTSDSDENAKKAATIRSNDPTADIVQRLIKEGKVRVATMRKGTGRPHLKHVAKSVTTKSQRNLKKNNKQKQTKLKQNIAGNEPNSAIAVQPKSNASLQLPIAMPADDCDNFDNCDDWQLAADDIEDEAIAQETAAAAATIPSKATKPHTVQAAANNENDGTFSLLARSVLIRQANDRQNLEQKQKAKQLLEIAKKLISTPKHDKTLGIANLATTNLSPIVMTPPTRFSTAQPRSYSTLATPVTAAKASPWRVDNAEGLPKVFNFARSSGNLPSFSSDYIPQTPRKDKTKRNSTAITSFDSMTEQQNDGCAQTLPTNRRSLTSSFSSNDSNVENRPPAPPPPPTSTVSASPTTTANNDENSNIFNLKQLPNPRRTLKNRSPLKTINILEVVQLAPWKKNSDISKPTSPESKKTCQDIQTDLYGFESMLHDSSMQESNDNNVACPSDVFETPVKTQCNKKKNRVTDKVELFGFEDFLSQTLNSQQSQESDDEDAFNNTINRQSITLYEKMQELKKLKPTNNELSETIKDSSAAEISSQNSNLFLNGNQDQQMPYGLRQRNIKEMLCSTMVSHAKLPELDTRPSTSKEALKQFKLRQRNKSRLHLYNNDGTLADLFNDLEPETTFNEEDPHRTYVRPYKRKRRLRENQFTVFIESDASDDDFDGVDGSAESPRKKTKKQKKKKNLSTETTDTSGEVKPKKKRQRKQLKEDPGLREFVTTFNEMCKEVDQYELLVE